MNADIDSPTREGRTYTNDSKIQQHMFVCFHWNNLCNFDNTSNWIWVYNFNLNTITMPHHEVCDKWNWNTKSLCAPSNQPCWLTNLMSHLTKNRLQYLNWDRRGTVTHICVGKRRHHWFRWWFVDSLTPSQCLNQMLAHYPTDEIEWEERNCDRLSVRGFQPLSGKVITSNLVFT